ncbi:hypothetical protein MMC22_007971, partial [Lobaria immixta]|nr:hypothetical protein [Lobaria immixta]
MAVGKTWASNFWSSAAFVTVILLQTSSVLAQADPTSATESFTTATRTSVPAHTQIVEAGNGDFQFVPDSISAKVGDIIEFRFFAPNHSVARAEFEKPCVPIESTGPGKVGFWSGFRPAGVNSENPPIFQVRVNDTQPVFFYCAAPASCLKNQMLGVINPNSSMTLEKQQDAAKSSNLMYAPGESAPNEDGTSTTATATPVSSANPAPEHTKHLSTGAIVGIAIAGAAVAILVVAFIFLLGRHSSLQAVFKRLHRPEPATPGPHGMSAPFAPGYQQPYAGSFASPRSEMGDYAPPYDAPNKPYIPGGQMSELATSADYQTHKGLGIQHEQILAPEHIRRQTISPPLG